MAQLEARRTAWEAELDEMTYGGYRPVDGEIKQREVFGLYSLTLLSSSCLTLEVCQALRVMEELMPSNAMVSTDIGNTCSISNGYLRFTEPRSFFAAGSYGDKLSRVVPLCLCRTHCFSSTVCSLEPHTDSSHSSLTPSCSCLLYSLGCSLFPALSSQFGVHWSALLISL